MKKLSKQQIIMEEQKKLFKNRKVVQLNKFIKGDVSAFSVNDLKIFKLIISKVDSKESLFKDFYEINTDEIKALNINEKHLYSETRKTLKRLANIYITFDEGDKIREVGLIRNDFKFDKYSKRVLINFNDDMGDYLINLKKNFFMYDLIDIVNFKFKHTLKFYEYIKSQSLNVIRLKVDTIKDILDLKNKYSRYTNFKRDVLEVILEEINECSNTLFISFSEEKRGPKVENIVFHIKRIKNDLLLEATPGDIKNKFHNFIAKECTYLNKYQTVTNIDIENFVVTLKEHYTDVITNIVKDDENGIETILKKLFGNEYESLLIDDNNNEVKRLKAAKDFKKFREEIIAKYKGQDLVSGVEGFDKDVVISVDKDTGYLLNKNENKIITKEESLIVWKELYKNKERIGKVSRIVDKYINIKINIKKINEKGNSEDLQYIITDITEEYEDNENKYRLHSKNLMDPFSDTEKSKNLLTLEQLESFINASKIDD